MKHFQLSPFWSWFFVVCLLGLVAMLVRFAVLAFLPLREQDIAPPEWVNPGMEPAKFEADVHCDKLPDGTYRITVIDADGVNVVVSGLDRDSTEAFLHAFVAGIDYAVGISRASGTLRYDEEIAP